MSKNYSNQDLIEAVKTSSSVRQVLTKLGLVEAGGNYKTIKNLIKELSLDTSHFFLNHSYNKGRKLGPKRPIEDYLSNKIGITTNSLKLRLIKEQIFQHKCQKCNNQLWLNEPIPLELHHIDGNSNNNNISNLELLCPNCHAKTNNYRGSKLKINKQCIDCGKNTKKSRCKKCAAIKSNNSKKKRPSKDELEYMIVKHAGNMSSISKEYNVSSTSIRKWMIHYNLYKKRKFKLFRQESNLNLSL